MSKREEEKAIEATKKVAEAKKTEDKVDATLTLQEIEGRATAEGSSKYNGAPSYKGR
jgi:hypothetical protein